MTTQDAIVISVAIVAGVAMFVAIILLIAAENRAAGRVLHVEHRGRRRAEPAAQTPNEWRWEVKRECPPPEPPKTEPTVTPAPTSAALPALEE